MWKSIVLRPTAIMLVGLGAALVTASCSGATTGERDALKRLADSQQQTVQAQQQLLSNQEKGTAGAQEQRAAAVKQLEALQQQLAAAQKDLASAQQKGATGLPQGGSVLLAANPVPSPTPRPTPTPLPPGYVPPTAPPPPVPSDSFLKPLALYIHADTITSAANESKYNVDATGIPNPSCVQTSVFKRGMHLVWRYEIVDTSTGKRLTDKEVASAAVKLPTGDEIKGRFGRHGSTADAPWFWTSSWDVPLDYPLGVLDWSLNVTSKDGKAGTFNLWQVSIPERGVEGRTQIIN